MHNAATPENSPLAYPVLKSIFAPVISRALHIFCSFWLIMLLLFGGTAKEAIHAFANHSDTEHHAGDDKKLAWGAPHHHCTFLSFHALPFAVPALTAIPCRFIAAPPPVFIPRILSGVAPYFVPRSGLRGPPVC